MKFNFFSKKEKEKEKEIEYDFVIIDSQFPQKKPMGFRNFEINGLLENIPNSHAFAMFPMKPKKEAWFSHGYGIKEKQFKENFEGYLKVHPVNKDKISYLPQKISAKLGYSYFLAETFTLLPYFEKNKIPFVFVLYPGGAFGLNNTSSDNMLNKIFKSPYFRKVIVTQKATFNYLTDKKMCPKNQIEYSFGGYVQFIRDDAPAKKYYKTDKQTFDVCFVAAKYSKKGVDKGYDLFIETAKHFSKLYDDMHFHVVGNFDETDIDVSDIKDRITFYGFKEPEFLKDFYSKMDVCLSPNRPYMLYEGNFDGFPLSTDSVCFGTVLMTTDELNNNDNYYSDEEIVIIRPDLGDIINKLDKLYNNLNLLYKVGVNGRDKLYQIADPKQKITEIANLLKNELERI